MDDKEILKLAKLSRLDVAPEEIPELKAHLDRMVGYFEQLRALPLEDVEPLTGVEEGKAELRADEPRAGFDSETAFANAPRVEADHFVIPKVIG